MIIEFRRRSAVFPLALILAFACAATLAAQEPETPAVTLEGVQNRLTQAQENAELSEAAKTRVVDLYTQALAELRKMAEWQRRASEFEQLRTNAEPAMMEIQQELLIPPRPPTLDVPDDATITDLERRLEEEEAELARLRDERIALEQEPARRSERRREIPNLQATARQALEETQAQLAAAPPEGEPAEVTEAKRVFNQARVQALNAELDSYAKELQSYDARTRLLTLRLDQSARRVSQAEQRRDRWSTAVAERRQTEAVAAARAAREALLEANNAPPEIRELAEQLASDTARLTNERTGPEGIPNRIKRVESRTSEVSARLDEIEREFPTFQTKVEAAGGSSAVGLLLRNKKSDLPEVRAHQRNIRLRQDELSAVQIELIEATDERQDLGDYGALLSDALDRLAPDASEAQRRVLEDVLRPLYEAKRKALDVKISEYDTYLDRLLTLEQAESALIEAVIEFESYIDERILWVRSGAPIRLDDFSILVEADVWMAAPERLMEAARALWSDLRSNWAVVGLSIIAVGTITVARRPMKRRLSNVGEQAARASCTTLEPTLYALLYTILLSISLPAWLMLAGWRLTGDLANTDYVRSVGYGLMAASYLWWSFDWLRQTFQEYGLGVAHFGWKSKPLASMRRSLLVWSYIVVPLFFFVAAFYAYGDFEWQETVGRGLFVALLAVLLPLVHWLMRPRGGALLDAIYLVRKEGRFQTRRIWYLTGAAVPVGLIVASALGYYYSAYQIAIRIHLTVLAGFSLLVFIDIIQRWTLLTRRKLAIERARKKLEALRAEGKSTDTASVEEELDLALVDVQTKRLIRSGYVFGLLFFVWIIWANVLPALAALDRVELWTISQQVTVDTVNADGTVDSIQQSEQVDITLRHAVSALLIGIITFIAVRNLPGMLEIGLLQRLSLGGGERYAITTILSYVLTIIGVVWAFSVIGLGWSRLQWLIAALGLGLGFGLQEIFANFVSGIIILFERPIRVGDVVTVGDISGKVTKIRIRATWITAFNRQELVVPNKEFVTARLVNWTLSDMTLRIEIPVGIAYGSDTERARQILYDVARRSRYVMKDPGPEVYFFGFGDNSLNFELRVFSPDLEHYLSIKDEMHTKIDMAFREAGIEIAFPQRDIHIRSIKSELPIRQIQPAVPAPLEPLAQPKHYEHDGSDEDHGPDNGPES